MKKILVLITFAIFCDYAIASNINFSCFQAIRDIIQRVKYRKANGLLTTIEDRLTSDQERIEALIELIESVPFPEEMRKFFPTSRDLRRNTISILWGSGNSKTSAVNLNITLEVKKPSELAASFIHEIIHTNQRIYGWIHNFSKLSREEWIQQGIKFEMEAYNKGIKAIVFLRSLGLKVESIHTDIYLAKKFIYPQKLLATRHEIPGFCPKILTPLPSDDMDSFLTNFLQGHVIHFETKEGIRSYTPNTNYFLELGKLFDRLYL